MNVFQTIVGTLKPEPQQQQEQNGSNQDTPWLITSAARAVGSIAGVVSILCGSFLILDILNVHCIFSGALLIIEGFLMILTEAPCCCVFFEFAYMPSTLMNKRPPWIKATIYLFFAAIPFFWCTGVSTFFSSGLIMATSALYLLMALGKKANREEMMAKSSQAGSSSSNSNGNRSIPTAPTSILVQNEEVPVPSGPGFGVVGGGKNQVLY
ncbi:Calcium channel flower [Dermatophagoides farinae]|uniref:Calcium channel flower n=1 Tax=Dermatophagoides farinae TaxID=6954 RepID=A0A922HUH0_DERFA|nr:Calcium channel flower [Dermatophagoides farinae]